MPNWYYTTYRCRMSLVPPTATRSSKVYQQAKDLYCPLLDLNITDTQSFSCWG